MKPMKMNMVYWLVCILNLKLKFKTIFGIKIIFLAIVKCMPLGYNKIEYKPVFRPKEWP